LIRIFEKLKHKRAPKNFQLKVKDSSRRQNKYSNPEFRAIVTKLSFTVLHTFREAVLNIYITLAANFLCSVSAVCDAILYFKN